MTKLNKGHWLEATDRISVTQNNIEENLCNHPAIKSKKKYLKLIDKAQAALSELYQLTGAKI